MTEITPATIDENNELARLQQEYFALMHAMQSGVKQEQVNGSEDGSPKHLRVGVNSAMASNGALVNLLIDKGVITALEYHRELVTSTRLEVEEYEKRLSKAMGVKITLL